MIKSPHMRVSHVLVLIICSFVLCAQSDVPRPRGVSLSKASLYSPTKDFTCFDGTVTIPFSYVNDDYCDCFDGSDEPGTSACLNGVFHCTNAGHRPQNLPSSRVNDGVCDCCDGTDEYATEGACEVTCQELGREARAEAQRRAELHKLGSQVRQELVERGNKKRNEMAEQLTQLEKDKTDAETMKAEKEAIKDELEAKENEALKVYREAEELEKQKKADEEKQEAIADATEKFNHYDTDRDGVLTVAEINVVVVFDKNNDGEVDQEEYQYFFGEKENVDLESFIAVTWPMLKPILMAEQGMFRPPGDERDAAVPETDVDDLTNEMEADEQAGEDEGDETDLQNEDIDAQELESDHGKGYDEETQRLVNEATEARRQFTDAERAVREIESNIRNIQQNLEKDYGLQQEFATLDGQCFEYEDKEYIYKLCMFQKMTQKSKNGGSEVGLGNWGEWGGEGSEKYSIMRYTNGVACWNGPNRITTVLIQCGLETKIFSVSEPYRCEYKVEMSTPAVCDSNHSQQHTSHDEL